MKPPLPFAALALAGKLFAFSPNATLSAIPENTVLDLGAFTGAPNGAATTCYPAQAITDFSRFTYDPVNHQMLLFGGGHSSSPRNDVIRFDLNTLLWSSMYVPTPGSDFSISNLDNTKAAWKPTDLPIARHTYDMLPFAPNTGELILMPRMDGRSMCLPGNMNDDNLFWGSTVKFAHYNPATRAWSWSQVTSPGRHTMASDYDPVSGLIILADVYASSSMGIYTYDPANRVLTKRTSNVPVLDIETSHLVYSKVNDKFYYMGRSGAIVAELTLNRSNWGASTITNITASISGAPPSNYASAWAYDSDNRIIGGGVGNGKFYAFDPVARSWTTCTMQIQSGGNSGANNLAFYCLDFDPVNGVFVFIASPTFADYGNMHNWAYRYGKPLSTTKKVGLKQADSRLEAAPNPFTHAVTLQWNSVTASTVSVWDVHGRLVRRLASNAGGFLWRPEGVARGVYRVEVKARNRVYSKTLLYR